MFSSRLDGDTITRLFALTSAQLGETVDVKDPGAREFPSEQTKPKEMEVLKGWNGDTWTTHEFKGLRHVQVSSDKSKSIMYRMIIEFFEAHPGGVFKKTVLLTMLNAPQHRDKRLIWFTEPFLRLVYHFCNAAPLKSSRGAVMMNTRRRKYDEAFLEQWDEKVGHLYARCVTADKWMDEPYASAYKPRVHGDGATVATAAAAATAADATSTSVDAPLKGEETKQTKQTPIVLHTCGLRTCFKQQPKMQLCSRCKTVRYCCADHQREHWSMHKITCKPVAEQE